MYKRQRQIPTEEAQAFANEAGLLFFEVSAKSGKGIKECFREIALKMPIEETLKRRRDRKRGTVDLNKRPSTNEQQCAC